MIFCLHLAKAKSRLCATNGEEVDSKNLQVFASSVPFVLKCHDGTDTVE
jgi:hypothetical protein